MRILDEGYQRARKEHQCDGCLGTIGIGDRYYKQANVCGGDFSAWKAHALCWLIVQRTGMDDPDGIFFDASEVRENLAKLFAVLFNAERMELVQAIAKTRAIASATVRSAKG